MSIEKKAKQEIISKEEISELVAVFRDAVSHAELADYDKRFLTNNINISTSDVSARTIHALGVDNAVIDSILVRTAQLSTRSDMERFAEALQPAFPSVSGNRWAQLINRCKPEN
jgi:hypothetical protein